MEKVGLLPLEESFQNGFVTSEIDRKSRATKAGNPTPLKVPIAKLVVPSRVETVIIAEVRNTKASE